MTGRERAKANALALRANGLSIREVAERLGVPKGTVGGWLRGRGEWYAVRACVLCGERFIAASGQQRFCTPGAPAEAPAGVRPAERDRRLPRAGAGAGGRARAAARPAGRADHDCKAGVVRRTEGARAHAVALRAQGLPSREIAHRLELPVSTVAAWLRRRPTFAVRACRLCGRRFVPTNGRQRFCTPAHQREPQRARPTTRDCRLCGAPFTPTNGRQRFCTPAHQLEHQRLHGTPRTVEGWREHVRTLEAELAQLHAQLPAREAA